MRGTSHVHCLLAIQNDDISSSDVNGENLEKQQAVKDLVARTFTAKLVSRPPGDKSDFPLGLSEKEYDALKESENEFTFCVDKNHYPDATDPRRLAFDAEMFKGTEEAKECLRIHYRRLQIANQMHRCCFTCYKYCQFQEKVCRFHFPYSEENCNAHDSTIVKDRDVASRVRVTVKPPRNNAYINATFKDELVVVASSGNSDGQYVMNDFGAVEYVGKYASKAEDADSKVMVNLFTKYLARAELLAEGPTDREQLKAAAQAMVTAFKIGTVQACYFLLNQSFVLSSRDVISINPLPKAFVNLLLINNRSKLNGMDNSESAVEVGPNTQLGRRNVYHEFVKKQYKENQDCHAIFFLYLLHLRFKKLQMLNLK